MRNWSVAGSIDGHAARSDTQIQAAHLRDFVQEFQRSVSGHQAICVATATPPTLMPLLMDGSPLPIPLRTGRFPTATAQDQTVSSPTRMPARTHPFSDLTAPYQMLLSSTKMLAQTHLFSALTALSRMPRVSARIPARMEASSRERLPARLSARMRLGTRADRLHAWARPCSAARDG